MMRRSRLEITRGGRFRRALSEILDHPVDERRASDRRARRRETRSSLISADVFSEPIVAFVNSYSTVQRNHVSGELLHRASDALFVIALSLTSGQLSCGNSFSVRERLRYSIRDDGTEHFSGNQDRRKIIVCAGTGFTESHWLFTTEFHAIGTHYGKLLALGGESREQLADVDDWRRVASLRISE